MALPIFKLVVLCMSLISYSGDNVTSGSLQIIPADMSEISHVEFTQTQQFVKDFTMSVGSESLGLRVVNVDNGLYSVFPAEDEDAEKLTLDLIEYFMVLNWDSLWTEAQTITVNDETLTLTPYDNVLYVNWENQLIFVLHKSE